MADLFHWYGNDLVPSAGGDLLTIEGTVKGQQSIVRRLLTAALSYIWEVNYGAGLGNFIGKAIPASSVAAVIRAQMYLEVAVSQTPPPVVTVTAISNGFNVVIQYVDGQTGAPSVLNFQVTPDPDNGNAA
jgi:hypothetical protein